MGKSAFFERAALALLPLALGGCSDEASTTQVEVARSALSRDPNPATDPASLRSVVDGDIAFGLALGRRADIASSDGNSFFSPHSIAVAFGMLYGGASGTSKTDLAKTFGISLADDAFHATRNSIGLNLESRAISGGQGSDGKGFRLTVENSFWGEKSWSWETPYLDVLAKNYGAGINLVDFKADFEGSRKTINAWTAEHTEERILDLLPERSLSDDSRFVLVNAVFFNAAWKEEFAVTTMPFNGPAGVKTVPAVTHESKYRYLKTDEAEVVSVPYEGEKIELVAILPKDLSAFEARLDAAALRDLFANESPAPVILTMPKLTIEGATLSLKNELSALGLASVFHEDAADFSKMTKSGALVIDNVYHQAKLKLDEKGTEAVAATAIVGSDLVSEEIGPTPIPMNVDHPYLIFIRDIPTGEILFQGRIVQP